MHTSAPRVISRDLQARAVQRLVPIAAAAAAAVLASRAVRLPCRQAQPGVAAVCHHHHRRGALPVHLLGEAAATTA
jgi:hypothetical protein